MAGASHRRLLLPPSPGGPPLPLAALLAALAAAASPPSPAPRCGDAAAPGLDGGGCGGRAEELSSLLQGAAAVGGKRRAGPALAAAAGEAEAPKWPKWLPSPPQKPREKFKNKPRVRREWRTLSDEKRKRVAGALWTLKSTSTAVGRKRYGRYFHNYDELLMQHACAVLDPRCDQGHNGPQFMTFHRLLLLRLELALLSVDPSIEALPYWDIAKDAEHGEYRNDPDRYIFTDKYFGSFQGRGPNHEVNDGLFANWPVAAYSPEQFGASSALARDGRCIKDEWFRGFRAERCNECCGKPFYCKCPAHATYTTYLRNHTDCAPHVVRWPQDPDCPNKNLQGSKDIVYAEADFEACQQYPENVRSWMQWSHCEDPSLFWCDKPPWKLTGNSAFVETMQRELFPALLAHSQREVETLEKQASSAAATDPVNGELERAQAMATHMTNALHGGNESAFLGALQGVCHYYGYYLKKGSSQRKRINLHHGNAHFKLCKDFLDLSTSPNDVGPFTGHHTNIDRSNMHFMMASYRADPSLEQKSWYYPAKQDDVGDELYGLWPYPLSGPFSEAAKTMCLPDKATYPDYSEWLAWTPGTLLGDTVNSGYPFVDLFNDACPTGADCSGRATGGYTHWDVIHYTAPERTPYTYDTLEEHYY